MGFRERIGHLFAPDPLVERAVDPFREYPGLGAQVAALNGTAPSTFLPLSVRQCLAIPAVYRAVSAIASLVAGMPFLAYRDGALISPTPRLVARPDPFDTGRNFLFGTAWNMAAYGEAIWYAAAEDVDRHALSVLNLPLHETIVDWDDRRIDRVYTWRGQTLDARRVRHIRRNAIPGEARGVGALQLCGAALSAAAEADEWAARYFAEAGLTAVHLHSEAKLTDAEADTIRNRWIERRSPVKVTSGGVMSAQTFGASPADAQLIEARMHSRGEVAVMFGMPAKLLEYASAGSSLTYQNVGDVMTEFARQELTPGYLEPIEDAMTDYLVRSEVARFDLSGLQRADPKTRFDIHAIAIDKGIYTADYAAQSEGITPGAIDTAPVPAAGPIPTGVPSGA